MSRRAADLPPILQLAERIKADIAERHLRPGDAYLNTQEVARHFRVNGTTANQAMQLLTQRGMLQRRQRRGTLVAQPAANRNDEQIQTVHLLMHQHYLSEGLLGDGLLVGLQRALPAAEIQFNYLPPLEEVPYAEKVISEVMRRSERAGFVLFRSTAPLQRLCAGCGIPTVVSGTLQPMVSGLASIDRDQRQIGALLTEFLVTRKCEKIVILMREMLMAGDHNLLDAVFETLCRLKMPLDLIHLRCLTQEPETIKAEVSDILKAGKSKTGFLCRSEPLARSAGAVCRKGSLIVVADNWQQNKKDSPYPYIQSTLSSEACGERIGNMLIEMSRKSGVQPLAARIPVKLVFPGMRAS